MLFKGPRSCGRRLACLGPLAAAVVLGLVALPASASAQPSDFYGVNVEPLLKLGLVPPDEWNSYVATMASDGLKVARSDANWSWVEPNAPSTACQDPASSYDWDNQATTPIDQEGPNAQYAEPESMDNLVATLARNDVQFIPVLDGSPTWAWGTWPDQLSSSYYCDYENFAAAFAERYGPNGTFWAQNPQLPYLPVTQYEIWTEANSTDFWSGDYCGGYTPTSSSDPSVQAECASDYAQVIVLLSEQIHAVDPSATVLASIGWQNFPTYLDDLYGDLATDDAPANTIGAIGFHPYGVDAPAIIELDEQLRTLLGTFGFGDLPIYDTEDGQPVVTSGAGATYSWDGEVTDASRAAMMSLASDALARGDCGVEDYLVYGIVGSGISTADGGELNDEGLMGLWSLAGDQPDLTADALIASAARWVADPNGGIVICGAGTTPTADLLPLGVHLTHVSPQCVSATITYRGNPLEGAYLVLSDSSQSVSSASSSGGANGSDAFGQAETCLSGSSPPDTKFTAYAQVSTANAGNTYYVAQSPTYSCPFSEAPCTTPVSQAALSTSSSTSTGGGSSGSNSSSIKSSYTLHARILRVSRHATKLRAQLVEVGGTAKRSTLGVWIRAHGRRARKRFVTHETLPAVKSRTFKLARLRRGERVVLIIAADTAIGRPQLSKTLTVR